jgi:acyl-coenzyme A synthetase/AMP-(fatty) acid ligase
MLLAVAVVVLVFVLAARLAFHFFCFFLCVKISSICCQLCVQFSTFVSLIFRVVVSDNDNNIASYQELHDEVCRLANVLKTHGVKKGDSVCIYMPMTPYVVYSMLACARIGAVHSVVFAGFSAEALHARIVAAQSKVVITADEVCDSA